MGDKLVDRYLARADRRDHVLEIGARRVAAADQHHLALVEFRVREGDVVLDDADHDHHAAMRDVSEGGLHRMAVSGRVVDDVETRADGSFRYPFGTVPSIRRSTRKPSCRAAKASRSALRSMIVTCCFAIRAKSAVPRPIGPAPITNARLPPTAIDLRTA